MTALQKPWVDAEPHMREWERAHGSTTFNSDAFDPTLSVGDWCSMAYVATESGGWSVAIKVVT